MIKKTPKNIHQFNVNIKTYTKLIVMQLKLV